MRNTYLWLLQLVTGVLIAVLLGIHIVVMHLGTILSFFGISTTDPTSWQSMIDRAGQGTWAGLYIALLAVGLYHGINGLRGIISEVTKSARTRRIVNWVLIAFGIVIFICSTYVPVALFVR